jgi:hypothetical protein
MVSPKGQSYTSVEYEQESTSSSLGLVTIWRELAKLLFNEICKQAFQKMHVDVNVSHFEMPMLVFCTILPWYLVVTWLVPIQYHYIYIYNLFHAGQRPQARKFRKWPLNKNVWHIVGSYPTHLVTHFDACWIGVYTVNWLWVH